MIDRHQIIEEFIACIEGHADYSLPGWMLTWFLEIANGSTPDAFVCCMNDIGSDLSDAAYQNDFPNWLSIAILRLVNDLKQSPIDHIREPTKMVAAPPADSNPTPRPRDPQIESKAVDLLGAGMPVGKVAEHLGVHRNTVGNIRKRVEVTQQVTVTQSHTEDSAQHDNAPIIEDGRSVLGEMRRIIPTLSEPFMKSDLRAAVLKENPTWNELGIRNGLVSGFQHLERTGKIARAPHDESQPGEVPWIRAADLKPHADPGPYRIDNREDEPSRKAGTYVREWVATQHNWFTTEDACKFIRETDSEWEPFGQILRRRVVATLHGLKVEEKVECDTDEGGNAIRWRRIERDAICKGRGETTPLIAGELPNKCSKCNGASFEMVPVRPDRMNVPLEES